jgi:proteasome accessory factor A
MSRATQRLQRDQVPKILGADVELGNFLLGIDTPGGTGFAASRVLLREIEGVPGRSTAPAEHSTSSETAIDWGRRYLVTNGGCAYIDSDHLELALPENRTAYDHVAYWRAMLAIARDAMARVDRRLPPGCRVQVLANCSDGLGQSYGSHLNVMITREAWHDICARRPHYLAFLAAFQISSIVFTGQGKVGSEHGRSPRRFQLSQRADFFEVLVGTDTMVRRSVVNSRDEPLCGADDARTTGPALSRLHVIFFDHTLCQVATFLRAGTLQIVAAMLEAGAVDPSLTLDDPLAALLRWSGDPRLRARARLASGDAVTAVGLQRRFLDAARRFADKGGCDDVVPEFDAILRRWERTLDLLERRDFEALGRELDWVLKLQLLRRVLASRRDLSWRSPALKHLDQLFASLDEDDGLFWACERGGLVDVVITDDDLCRARCEPPPDTRAWTRTAVLRRAGAGEIREVDWDRVKIAVPGDRWWRERTIDLPRPHADTRAERAALFAGATTLDEIARAFTDEAASSAASPTSTPGAIVRLH